MPVTIKVNGTNLSLVHKFSNGISTATIPDVCKTPTPGGPVPIPYPNIAQSITLSNGTTTVKGDKAMAGNKGSKFSLSNGDNAGTIGGVKSNVFMKEATWILYSFDVKMDNKNASRLTDPMYHNSENAANLAGEFQSPSQAFAFLQQAVDDCDNSVSPTDQKGNKKSCTKLGQEKHDCVEEKINQNNKSGGSGSEGTKIEGEKGYPKPPNPLPDSWFPGAGGPSRAQLIKNVISSIPKALANIPAGQTAKQVISGLFKQALGGKCFPDAAIVMPDGSKTFVDFKFPCPPGHPSGKPPQVSKGGAKTAMSPSQQAMYDSLGKASGNGQAWAILPRF